MKKYIVMLCATLFVMSCKKEETKIEETEQVATETSVLKLSDAQLKNFELDTALFQNQNLPTTIRLNAKTEVSPQNTVSITNPFGGYVKRIALIYISAEEPHR